MRYVAAWASLVGSCALVASAAQGAVLWMGLPNGTSAAWTADGPAGWTRQAFADLPDVGSQAFPALGDLDGDGDLDALVGEQGGRLLAFENAGTDRHPTWTRRTDWDPAFDVGGTAAPALGDLDGDRDLDALVGGTGTTLAALERTAAGWSRRAGWDVALDERQLRPALADLDRDGRVDLVVGAESGALLAFTGSGNPAAPFVRAPQLDGPAVGTRVAPALGDLDRDGDLDLLVTDGGAHSVVLHRDGAAWVANAAGAPADPGSGPAGCALAAGTLDEAAGGGGGGSGGGGGPAVVARLSASVAGGAPPLRVRFDGTASSGPPELPLAFAWDFGDGEASGPAPGGGGVDAGAAATAIKAAVGAYAKAAGLRDAKRYPEAVEAYRALADALVPLTAVAAAGPVSKKGTNRIDRVARWYLQKLYHDLGGIYLWHDVGGVIGCERLTLSLRHSRESAAQARAGGFNQLPANNGTNGNIKKATAKLKDAGCEVPDAAAQPRSAVPEPSAGGGIVEHEFAETGTFTVHLTVSAADAADTAAVTVVVSDTGTPPPPPPPPPAAGGDDAHEGFGASTPGGAGGRDIVVAEPTEAAVRAAIEAANDGGHAVIRFAVTGPIAVTRSLPPLTGSFVTIEGSGAALVGAPGKNPNLIDVQGHDVVVRHLRLRNGSDNLRAKGAGAWNVVFSHVSSTGAKDDGISIGYGAHDVTVQWCFLAGNTRSLFLKYGDSTNVSVHHTWILKQWVRGPLVSSGILADVRNVVLEDWTLWGTRFEDGGQGNVVHSLFVLGAHAKDMGGKPDSALRTMQAGPVFTAGNVYEGVAVASDQGTASAPLDAPPVTTWPVAEMAPRVRARAGCLPRDATDAAYVEQRTGWDVTESTPLRLGSGG